MENYSNKQSYQSPLKAHVFGSNCQCCQPGRIGISSGESGSTCVNRFILISEPVYIEMGAVFFVATRNGIERKCFNSIDDAQTEFSTAEILLSLAANKFGHEFRKIRLQGSEKELDGEFEFQLEQFEKELTKMESGRFVCT